MTSDVPSFQSNRRTAADRSRFASDFAGISRSVACERVRGVRFRTGM